MKNESKKINKIKNNFIPQNICFFYLLVIYSKNKVLLKLKESFKIFI